MAFFGPQLIGDQYFMYLSSYSSKFYLLLISLICPLVGCGHGVGISSNLHDLPRNGNIIYASAIGSSSNIFTASLDGTEPRRLTFNSEIDGHPSYSPSGDQIVFSSMRNGDFDIYLMRSDGSQQHPITSSKGIDLVPSFSPDGKKVIFESNRDGKFQLYIMNVDGSDQHKISSGLGEDMGGKFSPDGTQIAFASDRNGRGYDLFVMDVNGLNPIQLTNGLHNDFSRSWSPDSSQIVFNSQTDGVGSLFMINRDGGGMRRLTSNPGLTPAYFPGGVFPSFRGDITPQWSPDGRQIAFCSDRSGHYEVYILGITGMSIKQITHTVPNAQNISIGWGRLD